MDGAMRYLVPKDPNELSPNAKLNEHFADIDTEYNGLIEPVIKKWQGPVPEKSHRAPPPTVEEIERLKALGYVDDPAKVPGPK